MLAFDQSEYQKRVLAPLAREWEETDRFPGKLERYGLGADVTASDPGELADYLKKVASYWRNRIGKGRDAQFVKKLLAEHAEVEAELLSPGMLAQIVAREAAEEQGQERQRSEELEEALGAVVGSDGLISAKSFDRIIKRFGEDRRQEADSFVLRNSWRVEEPVQPTSPEVMKEINRELNKLIRLEEQEGVARPLGSERLNSLSLYGFLGLMQDASPSAIAEAVEVRKSERGGLGATDRETCLGTLIGLVDVNLRNPKKRESYDIALVSKVADLLIGEVERLANGDELSPSDYGLLTSKAGEYGLSEESARRAVQRAASEAEIFPVGPGPDPVFISCPSCGISNPLEGTYCRECGGEIKRECPFCHAQEPRANPVCGNCGHDFEGVARAERLEAEARVSLAAGRVIEAIGRLETALENDPERASLRMELDRLMVHREAAENAWEETGTALRENRFHAVLAGIEIVRAEVPDHPGDPMNPIDEVETRAKDAIAEADRLVQSAASARGPDEAERILAEALSRCQDCEPAIRGLAAIEPEPPSEVDATLGEGVVTVSWAASVSPGANRYSVSVMDDSLGVVETMDTTELSLRHDLPAGTRAKYEVRASRVGALSRPVATDLIEAIYPVVEPAILPSEESITISWKRLEGQQVRIVRLSDGGRESLGTTSDTSFEDRSVTLGKSYRYELTSVYDSGPIALEGPSRHLDGRPVKRPEPVTELEFERTAEGLAISFATEGTEEVEVFRVPDDWSIEAGTDLDERTYEAMGAHLPRAGDGRPLDREATSGSARRYIALSKDGPFRVAGEPVDYIDLEPVGDLQIAREGSVARLTWRWPEGVRQARILSRSDRAATSPDDASARSQEITLDRYQREGGASIACGEGDAHVTVFPIASIGSRTICGSSGTSVTSKAADHKVTYSVEFKKRGRRLLVRASGDQPIPNLVIVGRSGSAPVGRGSADEELTILDASRSEITVELGKRRRPYFVRAFIENPDDHPSVAIEHPAERDLRLT